MGEIVFHTLLRLAFIIPLTWVLQSYLDYYLWWITAAFLFYGAVIYPAVNSYKKFEEQNKNVIESSLCSTCKHFDKSAVLCMKLDKHPTEKFLPCEGLEWEPK